MTSTKINVSQLTLYNPSRLKDAEIVAAFVVRKPIFTRVLADIVGEKPASRAQHHLIVGQRGMGKSTMLARIAAELRINADLSKRFVPLVFAEEQYAVDRLSKFWLNCLDSLADAAERVGDTAASDRIDSLVRRLKLQLGGTAEKDEAPARAALAAFLEASENSAKRPVLLVDNLQLVFERLAPIEQHALRELLMRSGSPILVGASPSPPPDIQNYGAAFYDHLKTHYLRPLSADEMREVMLKLAETTDRADVRDKVLAHPDRLKTLRDLTGGNPRTVVTLFFLYTEDFSPSVFTDLENLLDRVTPLYKARIEELSDQQQVVISAVADHWAPITARTLSEATHLPMASISAQLDRLEKTGFVENVEIFGQNSAGYQIAERFFNVWFLMRSASRRQRREVEFLVRFIESFYEAKDRPQLAQHLLKEHNFSPDRFQFAKALAYTLDPNEKEELARHAELDALRQKAAEARWKLEEVIDFSKLPTATLAFDELREKLKSLVSTDARVTPEEFAAEVLGDRQMFIRGERESLAATTEKLSAEKVNTILESIAAAKDLDVQKYGEDSVAWFRQRLATGQLRSSKDLDDWNRSFLKADEENSLHLMIDSIPRPIGSKLQENVRSRIRSLLAPKSSAVAWDWYNWGVELHIHLGQFEEAEAAYRKAIELDPKDSRPWDNLGDLLRDHLGRFEEAEAAYRKAIELDPKFAWPWDDLGRLLQNHFGRFEEAEAAYRKAIELDPKYARPWDNLGDLLRDHLGRFEEAEAAYRKAIELDPKFAWPWNGLGRLLQYRVGRFEEAEAAYRKAIELDPNSAWLWSDLGKLLQRELGRFEEAEAAYRKAIELDPNSTLPWNDLGDLLQYHFGRFKEAEASYRKAIELDPRRSTPWNGLGNLLQHHFGRFEEAEASYRKAIELDPRWTTPWNGLGILLHYHFIRFGEAEAAYRKAIELDPKYSRPWDNLGDLLQDHLGRFEEAEAAYGKAIELDPKNDWPWNDLGRLLQDHFSRFEEAEAAYRKAIELDPKNGWTWNDLGRLLQYRLGRFEEAEAAYRKAIELDPKFARPWDNLGDLLRDHLGRFEEAEAAYRKAIELDPKFAWPWNGLGRLLQYGVGRFEEAEAAYRKAIELDPKYARPWDNLGDLLQDHLSRFEEAEAAYRKAIELDPKFAWPWNGLGKLLQNHFGRFEEAEVAYRKSIELDPRRTSPWNRLGNLYCDYCQRFSDAAAAFAKAIEIDSANESAAHNLVFLHRDFIGDMQSAKLAFELLQDKTGDDLKDTFRLHQALFAAYDGNWGLCRDALTEAIAAIDQQFPFTTADDWFRASAVLLHLNFGEELLAFLREHGDDVRLRPWYEALSALHRGDRRYLLNIPVEVRTTAEYYFDQIEKRLNALPEKTRRRPAPRSAKRRGKPDAEKPEMGKRAKGKTDSLS